MKKYTIPAYFLYCGGMLSSLDLKTAVIEIENDKFNATILPMQFHDWPAEGHKEPKIGRADRKRFAKRMKTVPNWSGLNQEQMLLSADGKYFEYSRPTSEDTYQRQFVLFERKPGRWILGVTLGNSPRESDNWYTDIYFLCKNSEGWEDCTKQILPPFSLEGFLKPGAVMSKKMKTYGYLKYQISKSGDGVEIHIIESRLPTPAIPPGSKPQPKNNELENFKGTSFQLKWNPGKLAYEFVP